MGIQPDFSEESSKEQRKKNPWVAVISHLFMPGLGHVYAGQLKKGLFIYIGLTALGLMTGFLALTFPC